MKRDAPRTQTSMRKVKKNVQNSNVSLSPSLKRLKVALNLSNYADQWRAARQTGHRQVAGSGLRPSCDWTDAGLVDRKDQSEEPSHHQDGRG